MVVMLKVTGINHSTSSKVFIIMTLALAPMNVLCVHDIVVVVVVVIEITYLVFLHRFLLVVFFFVNILSIIQ